MKAIIWVAVSSNAQASEELASLPDQERTLREAAIRDGYDVVDVLEIPGFSRRYYSWDEFAKGAAAQGILAPSKMARHWQDKDFDAVYVRDGSRFGRSQTLFSVFVEMTVLNAGALIITLQDGEIGLHNYRMFISMGSYAAATDTDNLIKKGRMGKIKRAERGINFGHSDPFTHVILRDKFGKPLQMVVDESKRRLWDDFLTVFCGDAENPPTPWNMIEEALYHRFGHTDETGRPYAQNKFHQLVFTAAFHGHSAYNIHASPASRHWLYDETVPVPEYVHLFRNTVQPVYTGEQATRFYAEINRRRLALKSRSPEKSYPFTGLLACAECGGTFVMTAAQNGHHYYICGPRRIANKTRYVRCSNNGTIRNDSVQRWINSYLISMIDNNLDDPFPEADVKPHFNPRQLEQEIQQCETIIAGLIRQIATAPDAIMALVVNERDTYAAKLATLKQTYHTQVREHEYTTQGVENRIQAFDDLKSVGLDGFWELPYYEQNKRLHQLMGGNRLAVQNSRIIGIIKRNQGNE